MQPYPIFCKSLRELPQSVCSVWFSHLTILEWREWSRLTFNQSFEIPGFVHPPIFCLKKHRRVRTFDLPLCSLEAHARCPSLPQCKALRYQSLSSSKEELKKQLILAKRIFQGREIVEGFFSWWIKSNDSYVEARCFDVLMMLKDQVLLSFIQDKNPRKSRYMIKLISRIFRKKFLNWKNKRFDQRILSFQIEICSLVIDYQQLKMF